MCGLLIVLAKVCVLQLHFWPYSQVSFLLVGVYSSHNLFIDMHTHPLLVVLSQSQIQKRASLEISGSESAMKSVVTHYSIVNKVIVTSLDVGRLYTMAGTIGCCYKVRAN